MTPEMGTLKATWMSGDYGTFAKYLEPSALEFLGRLRVEPGTEMLDVACADAFAASVGRRVDGPRAAKRRGHGADADQAALPVQLSLPNTATDGTTRYDAEYLEVVALRE